MMQMSFLTAFELHFTHTSFILLSKPTNSSSSIVMTYAYRQESVLGFLNALKAQKTAFKVITRALAFNVYIPPCELPALQSTHLNSYGTKITLNLTAATQTSHMFQNDLWSKPQNYKYIKFPVINPSFILFVTQN